MQTKNVQETPKGFTPKRGDVFLYSLLQGVCFCLVAFLMARNGGVPIKMTWVIVGSNH